MKKKRIFFPEISMCNDCLFARIASWASKPPQELIKNNSHLRDHRKESCKYSSLNQPDVFPKYPEPGIFFQSTQFHHPVCIKQIHPCPPSPPKKKTQHTCLMWAKLGTKLGSERSYLILHGVCLHFSHWRLAPYPLNTSVLLKWAPKNWFSNFQNRLNMN